MMYGNQCTIIVDVVSIKIPFRIKSQNKLLGAFTNVLKWHLWLLLKAEKGFPEKIFYCLVARLKTTLCLNTLLQQILLN